MTTQDNRFRVNKVIKLSKEPTILIEELQTAIVCSLFVLLHFLTAFSVFVLFVCLF